MRARIGRSAVVFGLVWALGIASAVADLAAIERARSLLAAGNAKQAFEVLAPLERQLSGQPEFDYLLGVAALDSGRIEDAVVAFERVLAVMPQHAGAQMDLARAYYAAGSFDLAEAAFLKLQASHPPPAAQQAIGRYLSAIQARKQQTRAGWAGFGEAGLGYDSNITGVPADFGAAALQAFDLQGIEPTGNAIKRSAGFVQGAIAAEYSHPLQVGWSLFGGGEARARAYRGEPDFNSASAELRAGGAFNRGPDQWRGTANVLAYRQEGDAPGDPRPTNDRRLAGVGIEWRHALDPRTQVGAGVQASRVKFPDNEVEDFNQLMLSVFWLKSFERTGVPLLFLSAFATGDDARNELADGVTTKSKNLLGARAYGQYSLAPKVQLFAGLGLIHRRDQDAFARSTTVEKGRDTYADVLLGAAWQMRERCSVRAQYAYSRNRSNVDIYDFERHEVTTAVRCDF